MRCLLRADIILASEGKLDYSLEVSSKRAEEIDLDIRNLLYYFYDYYCFSTDEELLIFQKSL